MGPAPGWLGIWADGEGIDGLSIPTTYFSMAMARRASFETLKTKH